jgi:hypothetical protein
MEVRLSAATVALNLGRNQRHSKAQCLRLIARSNLGNVDNFSKIVVGIQICDSVGLSEIFRSQGHV